MSLKLAKLIRFFQENFEVNFQNVITLSIRELNRKYVSLKIVKNTVLRKKHLFELISLGGTPYPFKGTFVVAYVIKSLGYYKSFFKVNCCLNLTICRK